MGEISTRWTQATKDPNEAMISLVSCLEAGLNAWIELRKNGNQELPIKIKNPLLDNPFNWAFNYGTLRNDKELEKENWFNDTEKDLTLNWVACFGERKAIDAYQKDGTISAGMFTGMGICHPVRIEDANYYRREIVKDGYKYGYFVDHWKPKDSIPYWVVDETAGDVFTICYTEGPVDKKEALKRAAQFMLDYADRL